jgi:hypothetical protein
MVAGLKPFRMVSLAANKVGWCIFGSAFDASLLSTYMSPASKAMNRCDLDLYPAHSMLCFGSKAGKLLQQSPSRDMQSLGYG